MKRALFTLTMLLIVGCLSAQIQINKYYGEHNEPATVFIYADHVVVQEGATEREFTLSKAITAVVFFHSDEFGSLMLAKDGSMMIITGPDKVNHIYSYKPKD